MSYLVDTNVLSELRRKQPQPEVVAWFAQRPRQTLYLSVLTLGEIRKGIERLGAARQQPLLDWLEVELPNYFWAAFWRLTPTLRTAGAAYWPARAAPCLRWTACWPPQHCSTT